MPESRLYLMAFSTRLVIARDIFTLSTSAVTSRMLSRISSTFPRLAMGRRRFKISSSSPLIFTCSMFIWSSAVLSILTSISRSSMIWFSRSISSEISVINSRYSSTGTSSIPIRESASTRIEVMGVFSSWDTLETNSWRDWSTALSLLRDFWTDWDRSLVSL